MTPLAQWLFNAEERHPQQVALIYCEAESLEDFPLGPRGPKPQPKTLTYQGLAQQVRALAGKFQELGISQGTCVGLLFWNEPAFVMGYFALLALGATVIPLNTRLTGKELSGILNDAQAQWVFSQPDFAPVLNELEVPTLQGLLSPVAHADSVLPWQVLTADDARTDALPKPSATTEQDLAVLIYTSGTTGTPKGVMLSHQNLMADATANAQVIEAAASDRFITISPLFHVFGQVNILLTAILSGASVVMVRRFSPRAVLEAIEAHRVTFMAAVPTMYQMMLSQLDERRYDLSSLRVCHSGAAPMAKEVFARVEKAFGAPVQEGYGLSEASSIVTSNPLHGVRKPGSVGLPIPGVRLQVMDEGLQPLPPGEIGEVCVQGAIVMQGYYGRTDETQKALVNGWLKTKDMAYRDEDGYVFIVDRKDDLMNVGGVKVYPREIEEVLYQHEAVQSVAVVGIPSALYHEEIKAFVVTRPGASPRKVELQKFCRERLAEFKVPKHIAFVEEIPQGATGKILRKALRHTPSPRPPRMGVQGA
jgi:long-chain acyl-CoA synthetase